MFFFYQRTKRLVDGHARQKAVDPKTIVPVLIGDWSEDAEAKILLTLDPIASMANGDKAAYRELMESITVDSLELRDLLDKTIAGLNEEIEKKEDEAAASGEVMPEMELRPFEHYDYVVVLAKNTPDWEALCELLQIKKVNCSPLKGKVKIGLGRAIDAGRLLKLVTEAKNDGNAN